MSRYSYSRTLLPAPAAAEDRRRQCAERPSTDPDAEGSAADPATGSGAADPGPATGSAAAPAAGGGSSAKH